MCEDHRMPFRNRKRLFVLPFDIIIIVIISSEAVAAMMETSVLFYLRLKFS